MNMKNQSTKCQKPQKSCASKAMVTVFGTMAQWQWHCSSSCHTASGIRIFKKCKNNNQPAVIVPATSQQARQHCNGTTMTASLSQHNGSSILALLAIQPVMVCGMNLILENNN